VLLGLVDLARQAGLERGLAVFRGGPHIDGV
jgi:hypothetical protein